MAGFGFATMAREIATNLGVLPTNTDASSASTASADSATSNSADTSSSTASTAEDGSNGSSTAQNLDAAHREDTGGQAKAPTTESTTAAASTAAAATATADPDDDISSLPLHLQERGKQLVAQKNAAKAEAEAARREAEELRAQYEAALEEAKAGTSTAAATTTTADALPAAIPPPQIDPNLGVLLRDESLLSDAQKAELTGYGFTGPFALDDFKRANARAQFIKTLEEQVDAGDKTLADVRAEIAEADRIESLKIRERDLNLRDFSTRHTAWQQENEKRQTELRQRAESLRTDPQYEYAPPDILAGYISANHDPVTAAKYIHEQVAPIVERVATARVNAKVAEVTAAKDAEIATLKEAHAAEIKVLKAKSGAPSTTLGGSRAGGTAPANGADPARPVGHFGFAEKARQKMREGVTGQ